MKNVARFIKLVTVAFIFVIGMVCIIGTDGGGGGDDQVISDPSVETSGVIIAGTVDDGALNSPIRYAECRFEDISGTKIAITTANENGEFRIYVPPDEKGYIRCAPPALPRLILSSYSSTEGRAVGEMIVGENLTPAMTVFNSTIAPHLLGDLSTVKENFIADTKGLGDIRVIREGDTITDFHLSSDSDPTNKDVGLVAFSAISLFNIFYKNEVDIDYQRAIEDLIDKKAVDPDFLMRSGVPANKAMEWSNVLNASNENAGDVLGTTLGSALSKARIRVKVTDRPGGDGVPGAEINIINTLSGVECEEELPVTTDADGEVLLTLIGVPETEAIQIEVEAFSVPGFEPKAKTTHVVAFATVDLEIAFSYKLTVQGEGTGNGNVESLQSGINCEISMGIASGDDSESYDFGTEVTLTAEPLEESNFAGWSGGGCSGIGNCMVTMNQAHTVTANFMMQFQTCTYSISPASRSFTSSGGTGTISVTAPNGCDWTASESAGWISITSGSSNFGDGTVSYSVPANTSSSSRTATITVAGKSHTVTQNGVSCTYAISPTTKTVPASTGNFGISVTSPSGCSWTATESVGWISITSGNSGSGNGTVSYSVPANTSSSSRTATITVAGKSHTVTQSGVLYVDIISPTIPTMLTLTPSGDWISISWNASTDNIGVDRYEVSFCESDGTICVIYWGNYTVLHPETSEDISGIKEDTFYCARIRARDAANNYSAYSEVKCTRTPKY